MMKEHRPHRETGRRFNDIMAPGSEFRMTDMANTSALFERAKP